jgi:hypothetical protein
MDAFVSGCLGVQLNGPIPGGKVPPKFPLSAEISTCFPKQGVQTHGRGFAFFGVRRSDGESEHSTSRSVRAWTNGATLDRQRLGLPLPQDERKLGQRVPLNYLRPEEWEEVFQVAARENCDPWQLTAEFLEEKLRRIYQEMGDGLETYFRRTGLPGIKVARLLPFRCASLEFYVEYPFNVDRKDDAQFLLERAVAPELGLKVQKEKWTLQSADEGLCAKWLVPEETQEAFQVLLKLYAKGDMLRLELQYRLPRIMSDYRDSFKVDDLEVFVDEVGRYADKAYNLFERIHTHLRLPQQRVSREKILAVLKSYGIRAPDQNMKWQDFLDQICVFGVYQPARARLKNFRICPPALRDKLAHPEWGILERKQIEGLSGEIKKVLYLLRPNWEAASLKWSDL